MAEREVAPGDRAQSRGGLFAALGAVGAAFLAALCCVGPLVFVAFGVGAGLASSFEPLRPLFTMLTLALLAVGFYVVYGRRRIVTQADGASGGPDGSCAVPRYSVRDRILLWVATLIALVFVTFPQWSVLFL